MPLKLMYITNNPEVAVIAEKNGVDRIFVDMEYIGKSRRQGGMDTVQSRHTVRDIMNIKKVLKKSELLVRCNPIHDKTAEYCSSEEEIDAAVENGADILMLPYYKSKSEVERFIGAVGGRTKTMLLCETRYAAENMDEVLSVVGIDEIHIGLNDLSLEYGFEFMFEPVANGMVEALCRKISGKGLRYGFGGIGRLGSGTVPAEKIIAEHYRIGSGSAILSRSFCDVSKVASLEEIERIFGYGLRRIREYEKTLPGNGKKNG